MRRRLASGAEVADRAHQSLSEMVLPDAIDHHPRQQRPRALVDVGDPFGQGATLLGAVVAEPGLAGGVPVVRREICPSSIPRGSRAPSSHCAPGSFRARRTRSPGARGRSRRTRMPWAERRVCPPRWLSRPRSARPRSSSGRPTAPRRSPNPRGSAPSCNDWQGPSPWGRQACLGAAFFRRRRGIAWRSSRAQALRQTAFRCLQATRPAVSWRSPGETATGRPRHGGP